MMPEELYNEEYFTHIRGGHDLYERFVSIIALSAYRDRPILDVGCGRGDLLRHLIDSGCRRVAGFDVSFAGVAEARRKIESGLDCSTVKQGSITDGELFPCASFDLAFMTDVVEHLPPDVLSKGLTNVRRWLSRDGTLLVHTFPTLGPHRMYQLLLRLRRDKGALQRLNAIHCNVQTRRSLHTALEQAGFCVERLWIQNDFLLTSSAYKAFSAGFTKKAIGILLNDVLGSAAFRTVLGEFAALSIYAVAHPSPA
jgi:cyclopropane fatty-acyl-phospholipid synthase-like methyltransferase